MLKLQTEKMNKVYIGIALIIIAAWVAPFFILGQDAHMRIHDNLDSNIAWYKVLNDSGQLFGPLDAHIPQIINGELLRNSYYSQFYIMVELFNWFPPVFAYGLSHAITRFLAFLGMYLLLTRHVLKKPEWHLISIGVALTFSLTQYWPSGMLSQLGMPLALWAFLNIRKGDYSWKNFLTLTILPFLSSFELGFFFFLSAIGIFWLIDVIRKKKWNWPFFFSIAYMSLIYLAIDYRLVASMLMPHEPTNRLEFYESKNNLFETIRLIVKNYIYGHNQDRTSFAHIILPLSLVALLIVILRKSWRRDKLLIGLHIFNVMLSVWYAFWFYEGWQPLKDRVDILTTFNFSRYHYFHPMVQYALFAVSLYIIWRLGKKWRLLVGALILAQIINLVPMNEQVYYAKSPSFGVFYAVEQFDEIKDYIGEPVEDYRVVSIGLHPAIAQYNGLYTLDTYSNMYPLAYKHQFRKIIAPELEKSRSLQKYYDEWGGRCYIFVPELGKHYMYSKNTHKVIKHLDLNMKALKAMGGDYILSAVPILNAKEEHLKLEKAFENKHSNWKIYLYKVGQGDRLSVPG